MVGTTPLQMSAHQGHQDIVKLLINYGANVNQTVTHCIYFGCFQEEQAEKLQIKYVCFILLSSYGSKAFKQNDIESATTF